MSKEFEKMREKEWKKNQEIYKIKCKIHFWNFMVFASWLLGFLLIAIVYLL